MASETTNHLPSFIYLAYLAETALVVNLAYAEFAFERFVTNFGRKARSLHTALQRRVLTLSQVNSPLAVHNAVEQALISSHDAYSMTGYKLVSRVDAWNIVLGSLNDEGKAKVFGYFSLKSLLTYMCSVGQTPCVADHCCTERF